MDAVAGLGILLSLFMLAMVGMLVAGFVLWVWAFLDVVKRQEWMFASGSKVLWAIVVCLGGPLGAVVYMAVGRPRTARAF